MDKEKFKCHLCSFSSQCLSSLNRHKGRDHFDDLSHAYKYKCESCRLGFFARDNYSQHVNIIHKDDGSRFKCIVMYKNQSRGNEIEYPCDKMFQMMASARRHLQLVHKIRAKDGFEAKKYLKIVMTSKNQLRRSISQINNKNISIAEREVVAEVDDPDEILKILENDQLDDVLSNVPCLSGNICIIEEKFIPDYTPAGLSSADIRYAEIDVKPEPEQITTTDIKKPYEKKLTGKNKVSKKKIRKKLSNLPSKKVNVKPQQVQQQHAIPLRASLSRSCKNSIEISESSAHLGSGAEAESESETEFESESDCESELESDSILKSKSPQKDKNKTPLSCHLCHKIFSRPDHLRYHLVSSLHPENRVECIKCPESHFVVKGTLVKHHKDVKHGRKRLKNVPKSQRRVKGQNLPCTECDKVFDNKHTLRNHQRICNVTEKNFHCKECNLSFKSRASLQSHLKIGSRHAPNKGKRFFCEQCSSGFTKANSLKKHVQTKHEKNGTRFECNICHRSYGRADSLAAHFKREEHKLKEQEFHKKNQKQENPLKIKKEK